MINIYEEEPEANDTPELGVVLNAFDLSKFKINFLQTNFKTNAGMLYIQKKFLWFYPVFFKRKITKALALDILLSGFINTECQKCSHKMYLYELNNYPGKCPECGLMYYTSHLSTYEGLPEIGRLMFTYKDFIPDINKDILGNIKQYFKFSNGFLNVNHIVRLYREYTNRDDLSVEKYCNEYIQPVIKETDYSIQSIPLNISFYASEKDDTKETLLYRRCVG